MRVRRVLLLFPLVFLAIAFTGLLSRPSDFVFPYPFWGEGLKTLKRFSYVWAAIGLIFFLRKSAPIQKVFEGLSRIDRKKFLGVTLGLSFFLRVAWCFVTDYQPTADALWFMATAKNIFLGNGLSVDGLEPTAVAPPGYPYFLAMVFALFGDRLIPLQILQSLMDVAAIFFVFLIAERTFGKLVALLTTAYLAFSPHQIFIAPLVVNEHLFMPAVFFALYLLVRDLEKDSWPRLLAAGLLLGLSNLTRGVLMLFPPLLFFLYLFAGQGWKKSILKSGLITLVSAAAILPWAYRNYKAMGHPVPICTSAGYGFYTMNSPIADPYVTQLVEMDTVHPDFRKLHPNLEVARHLSGNRYAKEWILSDPWRFIRLGAGKLINLYGVNSYWSLLENLGGEPSAKKRIVERIVKKPMRYGYLFHFSLFFVGVFLLVFRYGWKSFDARKMLILLLIYFLTGIYFLFSGQKRYRQPLEPLMYMTSAFTLVYIVKKESLSHGLSPAIR